MNSKEIESAVNESLKSIGIEMTAKFVGATVRNDNWECDAWRITFAPLDNAKRDIAQSFDFYTGVGHRKSKYRMPDHIARLRPGILMRVEWEQTHLKPVKPSAASVLHSLLLDASANDQSFNDWCDELGYDNDSMKAFETYQACCNEAKKLNRLFTRAQIEALRELLQDY